MSRGKPLTFHIRSTMMMNYTFGLIGTKRSMLLPSAIPSKFNGIITIYYLLISYLYCCLSKLH